MRYEGRNIPGPDWKDVDTVLRAIQGEHCCNIHVELHPPVQADTPVLFWVKVRAEPRIVGRRTVRQAAQVSHRYPTGEARTLPALVVNLLYRMDKMLEDGGHCPAEQAEFVWGSES